MTSRRTHAALPTVPLLLTSLLCSGCSTRSAAPVAASAKPTPTPTALTPRTAYGFTLDVPADWSEKTNYTGGSFVTVTFGESGNQESISIVADYCTGCIRDVAESSTTNTAPYLEQEATAQGQTDAVYLSPYRATFGFAAPNGTSGYGLVDINADATRAIKVKASVLPGDSQLAQRIIASVH